MSIICSDPASTAGFTVFLRQGFSQPEPKPLRGGALDFRALLPTRLPTAGPVRVWGAVSMEQKLELHLGPHRDSTNQTWD